MDIDIDIRNPMADACSEFGLYLNSTGTAEAISTALLDLFLLPEKPDNPIEFIREHFDPKLNLVQSKLKEELTLAQQELAELQDIVEEVKAQQLRLIKEQAEREDDDDLEYDSESKLADEQKQDGNAETSSLNENGKVQESHMNEIDEKLSKIAEEQSVDGQVVDENPESI